MYTKTYRVYGASGHRQRESFSPSYAYDFSEKDDIRILNVRNFDLTKTHDYTEVEIIRNTEAECDKEIDGQISDGIFENSRTGKVEVFENGAWIPYV